MDELEFAQAVEMGDHGIELVDHVLLLIGGKRTALDTYCVAPSPTNRLVGAGIGGRLAARRASKEYIPRSLRSWDRKGIEDDNSCPMCTSTNRLRIPVEKVCDERMPTRYA